MADLPHSAKSTVIGIYLAVGSFMFFAMQDAAVKWLVAAQCVTATPLGMPVEPDV